MSTDAEPVLVSNGRLWAGGIITGLVVLFLAVDGAAKILQVAPVVEATEKLGLSRDSILVWHFRSFSRKRARMRAWAASEDVPILLFRRPAELERWLASLERDGDRSSPSTPTPGPVR